MQVQARTGAGPGRPFHVLRNGGLPDVHSKIERRQRSLRPRAQRLLRRMQHFEPIIWVLEDRCQVYLAPSSIAGWKITNRTSLGNRSRRLANLAYIFYAPVGPSLMGVRAWRRQHGVQGQKSVGRYKVPCHLVSKAKADRYRNVLPGILMGSVLLTGVHLAAAQTSYGPINLSITSTFSVSSTAPNQLTQKSGGAGQANANMRLLRNFTKWDSECDSECKITLFNEETPMQILGDKVAEIDNPILTSAFQIATLPSKLAQMGNQLLGQGKEDQPPPSPDEIGIPADPTPAAPSYHDQMQEEFNALLGKPNQ